MATTISVEEIDVDDREVVVAGHAGLRGRTLASICRDLQGFSGELLLKATGERIPISVEQWSDRDPDSTWLAILVVSDEPKLSEFVLSPAPGSERGG